MLQSFQVQNFKGHRDTSVALRPLTLFVGPNASGKTSLLEALQTMGLAVASDLGLARSKLLGSSTLHRDEQELKLAVQGVTADHGKCSLEIHAVKHSGEVSARCILEPPTHVVSSPPGKWSQVKTYPLSTDILSIGWYAIDPVIVARLSPLESAQPAVGLNGHGAAAVLATIKLTDHARYQKIVETLRQVAPYVEDVHVSPVQEGVAVGFGIEFDFRGSLHLPAHAASSGTLIALALITALYGPNRPRIVLLDELDHSLHPRAQMELVRQLRELVRVEPTLQILATTHSPYVLDAAEPEDVRVFAQRADGSVAVKPLTEHPQATKLRGTLSAGELWSLDDEQSWVVG
ncbi:MAG: AAA family ATPase [Deltaproteobacteria bacterium]|nr:AAA family ATPase [Deltaproteobacteria bacterium]